MNARGARVGADGVNGEHTRGRRVKQLALRVRVA
jgi:hypothetical protein